MPAHLFEAVALRDFTLGGYSVSQGESLVLLGTTPSGRYHLALWRGPMVSGFATPFYEAGPNPDRSYYGAAARETPLLAKPQAGAPVVMTLHPGCPLTAERLREGYSPVITEAGCKGYVATADLAFSLGFLRLEPACPVVAFAHDAELLQRDRASRLASQAQGVLALELASREDWRLVRTWDQQFTGWVKAEALVYTGETQSKATANGLPAQALALVTAPETPLYRDPQDACFIRDFLPQGRAALAQGVTEAFLQLPQGFADPRDFTLLPVSGAETCLYTVTLKEGQAFPWNGLTLAGPGTYDLACLPGQAPPAAAQPWELGELRLSLAERVTQGSGSLLGLHVYVEDLDVGTACYRLAGLGQDSWYAVYSLGGELLRRCDFSEENILYEDTQITDFLVYHNCRVEMLPGNG